MDVVISGCDRVSAVLDDEGFLAEVAAESMGWLPLGEGVYLHRGCPADLSLSITVTGMPDVSLAGMNVLLLG